MLVALRSREVSAVSLPLVASLRLWRLDAERSRQERQLRSAGLIGFDSDDEHRKAVVEAGSLPERGMDIRWLAQLLALGPDAAQRGAMPEPGEGSLRRILGGVRRLTLDTVSPAWRTEQRRGRGRDGSDQFQWQRQLGRLLAGVAEQLPTAKFRAKLLTAILDQPDETAMRMLAPIRPRRTASSAPVW